VVLRLALVGFVLAVLALSLTEEASPVAGETMSLLRVMGLRSAVSPVLSRSEEHSLPTAARLASPPDESFTLDDYDWDDDDASDMLLLIPRAHILPPTAVCRDSTGSTQTRLWPTHYLVRPQLLTRL
jgi:hypothetical protein